MSRPGLATAIVVDKRSLSERDICTKFITPALRQAGWDEMLQIREEVSFTKGRIIVRGKLVSRDKAGAPTTSSTQAQHPAGAVGDAEYNARINCGTKIAQSFKDVVLPDMKQARNILNSMSESIRREMDSVSGVEAQVVELDKSIEASQKAVLLIQKIHRVACLNHVIPDPSLLVTQEHENDRAKDNVAPGFCGYQTIRNADGVWVCRR